MNILEFRNFCMQFKGVEETMPFDDKVLAFKVLGKVFALTHIDDFKTVNLKCDPERAIELREQYTEVEPGYHMSKKHWNTVRVDGQLRDDLIMEWTKDSYDLVVSKMTKKLQAQLKEMA